MNCEESHFEYEVYTRDHGYQFEWMIDNMIPNYFNPIRFYRWTKVHKSYTIHDTIHKKVVKQ